MNNFIETSKLVKNDKYYVVIYAEIYAGFTRAYKGI